MATSISTRVSVAALLACLGWAGPYHPAAAAEPQYKFNFVMHSNAGQPFWGAVNKGMTDACKQLHADCQMLFLDRDGDLAQELSNFQASVAQQVDGIVTTVPNGPLMLPALAEAKSAGIPVVIANTDAVGTGPNTPDLPFIGQDLEQAGYDLAATISRSFKPGPVAVLVNAVDLSQAWAAQRTHGIERFMQDFKKANPDRKITWDVIEATYETPVEASRVSAYAQAHPDLSAVIDVANAFPIAQAFKDLGYKPGQVLVGGFDIMPPVVAALKSGYQQVAVDQQPYLQGYLSITELYMMKRYQLGPWSVNTGRAMITKDNVDAVAALSQQGYR